MDRVKHWLSRLRLRSSKPKADVLVAVAWLVTVAVRSTHVARVVDPGATTHDSVRALVTLTAGDGPMVVARCRVTDISYVTMRPASTRLGTGPSFLGQLTCSCKDLPCLPAWRSTSSKPKADYVEAAAWFVPDAERSMHTARAVDPRTTT